MRPGSPQYEALMTTSHDVIAHVSSWRGGRQLAENIPVASGSITYDDTADLRRRLSITVPARDPTTQQRWDPGDSPSHPLAAYGQRLHVSAGLSQPGEGGRELFDQGWYLITSWELDTAEDAIVVTAVDLAQLIIDARHYTTTGPKPGNTYAAEFARLVAGILPTAVDPGLPAGRVNPATVWERERNKNLTDLCKAWPARWYVDDTGTARAAAPYAEVTAATVPDVRLVTGAGGTLVRHTRSADRERLYNAVVATGKVGEEQEPAPWAAAEITDPRSPIRVGGPYGQKPRFYQSDLLTTRAQCLAAARSMLPDASRVGRSDPVEVLPDYRLELGDVAAVQRAGDAFTGRVTSIELPLTPSGPMSVTLSNVPQLEDES